MKIKKKYQRFPKLPKHLERYVKYPYGGLLGNAAIVNVVQEIVADPDCEYTIQFLKEMTHLTAPSIKKAMNVLVDLKLLHKPKKGKRPVIYKVNLKSHQLMALTFLAYSTIDDREGTHIMRNAARAYIKRYDEDKL